jgi:nucleotide-binding universal stress UspA family protein
MYKKILISTDGTDLSDKAVTSGLALAKALDAQVVGFTAAPSYPTAYFEGAVLLSASEIQRIETDWKNQSQMLVDAIQKKALAQGVKAESIVGKGTISESIIKAAKTHQCDLIVMASHGRKGIKRVLMGSETLDVLTHSPIPVLVLR